VNTLEIKAKLEAQIGTYSENEQNEKLRSMNSTKLKFMASNIG